MEKMPHIEHVLVRNPTNVLAKQDFVPDVIFSTRPADSARIGPVIYRQEYSKDGIRLLVPHPQVPHPR
jgi:hypothetical protein